MIRYLTVEHVIKINAMVISQFTPKEIVGLKDANALQRVIEQPKQEVFGEVLYSTVFVKAAILFINLIKKYPFNNANKRTAWVVLISFLDINGDRTFFPTDEGIKFTLTVTTFSFTSDNFDSLKGFVEEYFKNSEYISKK
ncbi:death on curing protein [Enterococcus sp. AZ194]|uniref:type II toxin-antitoxin system death-on-curing family toxin n=1 Tax=Enterococcus sp. AZ194 TaxID=2774629 RepID=UPI003F22E8BD